LHIESADFNLQGYAVVPLCLLSAALAIIREFPKRLSGSADLEHRRGRKPYLVCIKMLQRLPGYQNPEDTVIMA
jgi:hypothetical protein